MPNLFEEFRAVTAALATAGVPFAVCGGLAMAIHDRPRATIDIDLLAPPDAISGLVAVLAPLGFAQRGPNPMSLARGAVVMHRLTKVVPGDPDVLVLDVIEVRGEATVEAWATRVSEEWEGRLLTVVSRAGLIVLKRLRDSPQDRADIAALEGNG